MKIAVMMSTYNGENYLDAQLESLANQTVAQDMTLYIRDDGSKDTTFSIIDRWKDRMSIVMLDGPNLGPAKSFWELMCSQQIQADYYAFCDQDDVWDPDKLEIAISHLTGDTHLYACNCRLIGGKGEPVADLYTPHRPKLSVSRLFVAGVAQGCAMVFTDALRQFVVAQTIRCVPMHDIIVMLYALGFGSVYWDHTPRFSYRVHSHNVVARENKSLLKKLRSTYWNWRNSSKNSMSEVAEQMLTCAVGLKPEDTRFLERMAAYRTRFGAKWALLWQYHGGNIPRRVLRSYRLRLILNLL